MPVYKVTNEGFEPLSTTSFEAEKIYERQDLQRMLRDQPDVLEQGLFIVAEAYGDWEDSRRELDLLALDKESRLVVVELKRSDDESLMDLQAIRYAAMVANMTSEQVIDAHEKYLQQRGIEENAETRIRAHLGTDNTDIQISTSNPRIILASRDFSKELTTSVLWLNQRDLDVTCVKLQPYSSSEGLFLETSRIIPIPDAEEYLVRLRNKERETERQESPQAETFPGTEKFLDAIEKANEDQQDRLKSLHSLAISLKSKGLASLKTRVGSYNTVLRIELPRRSTGLVYVFSNKAGYGYLQFNADLIESLAQNTKPKIEGIIGQPISSNSTVWELPEGFVDVLEAAYLEANGERPSDTDAS